MQRCQKLAVGTVKLDKTDLLLFLGVSRMHSMKVFFQIWDRFVSNGASLMHKESLKMHHKYKYNLWGCNSSLCILSDFYALSYVFPITFVASMSGLDQGFEDALCQAGLGDVIQGEMIATRPGDGPAAPKVPIGETLAPSKTKKGKYYVTCKYP